MDCTKRTERTQRGRKLKKHGEKSKGNINAKKTKYMFMSRYQTTGQNHYVKVACKSFRNVAKLKYLEAMLANKTAFARKLKRDYREFLQPRS
jgi:uncharacterized protein YxeA